MDGIKGFFDSFKEFVWDIIGYLLPGSFLLIVLSVVINESYFYTSRLASGENSLFVFIFLVLSYLLGYIIYGFGLLKESIFGKYSYKERIESKVATGKGFLMCKQVYIEVEQARGVIVDQNISARELRTQVMSYIPEQDQKIYTFTFRSELANHVGNILLITGLIGLIFCVLQERFFFNFFKSEFKYIILYCVSILGFFILKKTRDRFYDISMRVPFSMFMAKVK